MWGGDGGFESGSEHGVLGEEPRCDSKCEGQRRAERGAGLVLPRVPEALRTRVASGLLRPQPSLLPPTLTRFLLEKH